MSWKDNAWTIVLATAISSAVSYEVVRATKSTTPVKPITSSNASVAGPSPTVYVVREVAVPQGANVSESAVSTSPIASASPVMQARPVSETEVATQFEATFASDGPPTKDARRLEDELRSAFMDPQLRGVELERAECRARFCQAELIFADAAADHGAFRHILHPESPLLAKVGVIVPVRKVQPDGRISATVYLYPAEVDPQRPM